MSSKHDQKRASMLASLQQKTGRSIEEWLDIARGAPEPGFMSRLRWLKDEYDLGHFQARLVVEHLRDLEPPHAGGRAPTD